MLAQWLEGSQLHCNQVPKGLNCHLQMQEAQRSVLLLWDPFLKCMGKMMKKGSESYNNVNTRPP